MVLIYFDMDQLIDYLLGDPNYNKAYRTIMNGKHLIWTGEFNKENKLKLISYNGQNIQDYTLKDISAIFVRGKNFPYKKVSKENKEIQIINPQSVEKICDNKSKTYKYLGDLFPAKVETLDQAYDLTEVVIKPVDGLKGQGIIFKKGIEVTEEEIKNEKLLVQEVIIPNFSSDEFLFLLNNTDLKRKIKDVSKLRSYDIRLVIVNKKIKLITLRCSEERICNMATGGYSSYININESKSEEVNPIIEKFNVFVDLLFEKLPKSFNKAIFSVDMCVDSSNIYKLYELNSYPGIRPQYDSYLREIIDLLNSFDKRKGKKSIETSSFMDAIESLDADVFARHNPRRTGSRSSNVISGPILENNLRSIRQIGRFLFDFDGRLLNGSEESNEILYAITTLLRTILNGVAGIPSEISFSEDINIVRSIIQHNMHDELKNTYTVGDQNNMNALSLISLFCLNKLINQHQSSSVLLRVVDDYKLAPNITTIQEIHELLSDSDMIIFENLSTFLNEMNINIQSYNFNLNELRTLSAAFDLCRTSSMFIASNSNNLFVHNENVYKRIFVDTSSRNSLNALASFREDSYHVMNGIIWSETIENETFFLNLMRKIYLIQDDDLKVFLINLMIYLYRKYSYKDLYTNRAALITGSSSPIFNEFDIALLRNTSTLFEIN